MMRSLSGLVGGTALAALFAAAPAEAALVRVDLSGSVGAVAVPGLSVAVGDAVSGYVEYDQDAVSATGVSQVVLDASDGVFIPGALVLNFPGGLVITEADDEAFGNGFPTADFADGAFVGISLLGLNFSGFAYPGPLSFSLGTNGAFGFTDGDSFEFVLGGTIDVVPLPGAAGLAALGFASLGLLRLRR